MKTTTYDDRERNGSRKSRLWVAGPDGEILSPGTCFPVLDKDGRPMVVLDSQEDHPAKGKFSGTVWSLVYRDDVAVIELLPPLHGKTWEQSSWEHAHDWIQSRGFTLTTLEQFKQAVRRDYPTTAQRWDTRSSAMAALMAANATARPLPAYIKKPTSPAEALADLVLEVQQRSNDPDLRWEADRAAAALQA